MKHLILFCSFVGFLSFGAISPKQKLEEQLRQAIKRDWSASNKINIRNFTLHKKAPAHAILVSFRPRPLVGAVSFEVLWDREGQPMKTFGSAIVSIEQSVAVANRDIRRGEELNLENVSWLSQEISKFSRNSVIFNNHDLEGKVARGFIRSGSLIQPQQIEAPAEITRGQRVDLVLQNATLKITAKMKALEQGRTGDWIKVENERTKRVVRSKVVGPGKVSLN